ncbi:unnamed protein product [Peronospora farinosa]|uniref:Uncharacterized protein n=1 Tax=Peronospora farinosa TaxID=134698 RepID=A0AAV0TTP2_9STRA|nr:unnamed protein product [Peronospora farinosa]
MNVFDVDRLINQMGNFICQKTQEKANEIRMKGLVKLFETDVVVAVRAKDVEVAEMVKVTVNKIGDGMVPDAKAGDVVLYAKQGKGIVCDNTLDTRLDQIYYDLKPTVRKMLFPTP